MLPPQSRHTMLEATLPTDPEANEVYTVPDGQVAGASYVLHIKKDGKEIGTAEQLERVMTGC